MCLGGHLAYRCALDPRVLAAVCYFATDLHTHSLGEGKRDDSLLRAADLGDAELVMVFGKLDNHVPPEGRDLIRKTLHEAGRTFSFYEHAWAQRMFFSPLLHFLFFLLAYTTLHYTTLPCTSTPTLLYLKCPCPAVPLDDTIHL